MRSFYSFLLPAALLFLIIPNSYADETAKDPYEDKLLGHWGGYRDRMADKGIDVNLEYTADILGVTSGGIKRGWNYLDDLDVQLSFDNDKLLGIEGNKAFIYFLNNAGGKPNKYRVGSVQGIDNSEVNTNSFKLFEAWDEQTFLDKKLAVLVGLHDLNAEFYETDMTANFMKPIMQVGQTLAQSGKNGPSIFPTTSLAGRVKIMPTEMAYISVAAFDGVPGKPGHPHGTHIDLRSSDGLLLIAEAGYIPKLPGDIDGYAPNKIAIGSWMYTKKMDDLVNVDASGNPVKSRMAGTYILSSYQFYSDKAAGHTLGAFLRAGVADGNTAQVDWDYEAGVVARGWVPSRPDSEMGIGYSQSHNSDKYMQSLAGASDRDEYGVELYYRDKLMPGIVVQPDMQYIVNPGTDRKAKNAAVIGLRFDIVF